MPSDVLIIGSGPAGYTAAIYAARAGMKTQVITGDQPGGQLMITSTIENYPGFVDPISGPVLMEQMMKQAEHMGVEIIQDTIKSVSFSDSDLTPNFGCIGESGMSYCGKSVIVATGASAKFLEIPGEKEYMGSGVSACATCDGFFFKNKRVAVIGGGNTAVEEAIFLTHFAESVTLIHRRDRLKAENIMQKRLFANQKINIIWNCIVEEIIGDGTRVTELAMLDLKHAMRSRISVDGVFVAIGHKPATSIFVGELELDKNGYIMTKQASTATSIDGVFAAGDVCDPIYRQAVTSAGQGCMAAMDADKFLWNY